MQVELVSASGEALASDVLAGNVDAPSPLARLFLLPYVRSSGKTSYLCATFWYK